MNPLSYIGIGIAIAIVLLAIGLVIKCDRHELAVLVCITVGNCR